MILIQKSLTEAGKHEFTEILDRLKIIEKEHSEYEHHAKQIFTILQELNQISRIKQP